MKRSFRKKSFAGKHRRLQNAQQVNCPIMILITSMWQLPQETLYPRSLSNGVIPLSRGQVRSPFNATNQIGKRLFGKRRLRRLVYNGPARRLFKTHFATYRCFLRFLFECCNHIFFNPKFRPHKQFLLDFSPATSHFFAPTLLTKIT